MVENAGAVIHVEGSVQGVGYRNFAEVCSQRLGLHGYCRNLPDGRVLVEVEGGRAQIIQLILELKRGPRLSRVEEVCVEWKPYKKRFSDFEIRYS